jgi:hypothetical protein
VPAAGEEEEEEEEEDRWRRAAPPSQRYITTETMPAAEQASDAPVGYSSSRSANPPRSRPSCTGRYRAAHLADVVAAVLLGGPAPLVGGFQISAMHGGSDVLYGLCSGIQ